MLDHAFGIFNNVSPRFQWAEIDLPFPSDDDFFRISNFDDMIAKSVSPLHRMKIKDAFLVLFYPGAVGEELEILRRGKLTALDMQMLIHCSSSHLLAHTSSN